MIGWWLLEVREDEKAKEDDYVGRHAVPFDIAAITETDLRTRVKGWAMNAREVRDWCLDGKLPLSGKVNG